MTPEKRAALNTLKAALEKFAASSTDSWSWVVPLGFAIGMALKTKSSKQFLDFVYTMLAQHHGYEKTQRAFKRRGTPTHMKKEREDLFLAGFIDQGVSQKS